MYLSSASYPKLSNCLSGENRTHDGVFKEIDDREPTDHWFALALSGSALNS